MAYNVLEDMLWLEFLKTLPATDQAEAPYTCQRQPFRSPNLESDHVAHSVAAVRLDDKKDANLL